MLARGASRPQKRLGVILRKGLLGVRAVPKKVGLQSFRRDTQKRARGQTFLFLKENVGVLAIPDRGVSIACALQ